MSSLIGSPGERWPLSRAVDALGEAARQAGRPSFAWIAGLCYPALGMGAVTTWLPRSVRVIVSPEPGEAAAAEGVVELLREHLAEAALFAFAAPFLSVFFLPIFRVVAGLALLGAPAAWNAARAGRKTIPMTALWHAGKGLLFPVYGLWLQLVLMQVLAFLTLAIPVTLLAGPGLNAMLEGSKPAIALLVLALPFVLLFAIYLLTLSVLSQLSLQSLVANRRGVSSALRHAWRIVQNDPWATARAALPELVLACTVLLASRAFAGLVGGLFLEGLASSLFDLALLGFAGVVRAAYWARSYRALGGLTPEDGVPGLSTA